MNKLHDRTFLTYEMKKRGEPKMDCEIELTSLISQIIHDKTHITIVA